MTKLFNLNFFSGTINELLELINMDNKISIFTPNVDHVIKIYSDKKIKENYSEGDIIIADGWPLVAIAKVKKMNIKRITGVDLMDKLLEYANNKALNIFFLGAEDSTLHLLKKQIYNQYPNIKNIEVNNGYFTDNELIINKINASKTDILFVGMGCPKQENWISENKDKLNCKIFIGVGGAFKIFSLEVARAPKIIQKIGLEWFYRFLKEPRRLFKRYFVDYLQFIPIAIKELIGI